MANVCDLHHHSSIQREQPAKLNVKNCHRVGVFYIYLYKMNLYCGEGDNEALASIPPKINFILSLFCVK
jgi:hypothetical protein